jgi:hypothetical protein
MNDIDALMEAESSNPPASGVDLDRVLRKGRRRRRRRAFAGYAGATLTAVAVVAIALVAGNVLAPATTRQQAGVPPGSETDPEALLGVWAVAGSGERGDVRLRFDAGGLRLVIECGSLLGQWAGNTLGQFVAGIHGSTDGCDPSRSTSTPAWLADAASFRVDTDAAVLMDGRGGILVRLSPRPQSEVSALLDDGPEALTRFRVMASPAPLPPGLTPATAESLVGLWLTTDDAITRPRTPSLRVERDSSWEATDGCNFSRGRWIAGPGGLVMATAGRSTLVACSNDPIPERFPSARRVGFDGELLVLVGPDGTEIGRLRPAPR